MKSLSFFKGLSWLILLNLLVKPVWIFFIDRQVQNIVGHEAYGRYFALLNLSYVLFFLADAGLSNMLNLRVASAASLNINQLLRIKLIQLVVYFAACLFIGWLTRPTQWDLLLYIVLVQMLSALLFFLRSLITAHQYFIADALFSVTDKLLMVILCGCLIYTSWFGTINLLLFLQIQIVCMALPVSTALFILFRKGWLTGGRPESTMKIVKWIFPFAMIILLMSAHYRLDGFLLERIHPRGAYEAGIYAFAYRLLDAGNMVGYLAASFLVPFIARHQRDKKMIGEVVINTRHGLMFFAIGLVSFAIIFASWIQQLLYHSTVTYNSMVIKTCIASLPGYFLVHIYGSVLTATSRFTLFIKILAISVVLNLTLNLILIPSQGAFACCIAALASQYFCGIGCMIATSKAVQIPLNNRANFSYILFFILATAFFYLSEMAVRNVWIILVTAACISFVIIATRLHAFKKYFFSLR